ncbi:MAG TPA: TVP38/TMEM64 family protein, partial [Syntrophales bacterium]|nr:TVP38/TMEM64 family protein [Syntrophales bacterium]
VVAAVPGLPISIAAAALYGALQGVILVSIGSTLGASLAFLISRYLARDAVSRWLSGNDKFRRLNRLTEEHGAIIVAITRLVPLFPFNMLNYGYGLTRIPFWTYVFWSWLCMLPGTIVYLVGTDALVRTAATGEIPWIIVGVFVAALAFIIVAVRIARGKLKEKERDQRSVMSENQKEERQ